MEQGISIIIPTLNGGQVFGRCLKGIADQNYPGHVQLIVIDSGSDDGTVELARGAGALVHGIDKARFHHARTRNEALRLARFDRVLFTVQDAVPCGETCLLDLAEALEASGVAAVYAEQVPHKDAGPYARFETESIRYGRGREPVVQALDSREQFERMPYHEAYRTIGLDNICAMYRRELLLKTPFPDVDFAEDLAWALENLLLGHRILYEPRVKVMHSHDRSPEYAFRRQVVNSFWCARIMGRVERDLSFVTARDLPILSRAVGMAMNRLGIETADGSQTSGLPEIAGWIPKRYPPATGIRGFLRGRLFPDSRRKTRALDAIADEASALIGQVVGHIRENYGVNDQARLMEVIDLAGANVLGRLYGEVYASRMLKGTVDTALEAIMRPFMGGV